MSNSRLSKLRTAWQIFRQIKNWPAAFDLRLRKGRPDIKLLHFRNGLNLMCRGGTREWETLYEVVIADGYRAALNHLKRLDGQPVVVDLGANTGSFTLLAAATHPRATVYAYEPGPPNYRLLEINCLANPSLAQRIELHREAVGGQTRMAKWYFDEIHPAGSSLYLGGTSSFSVQVRAWGEVLKAIDQPIALAKIDVEGTEFELVSQDMASLWESVSAIAIEVHDDPAGKMSQSDLLSQLTRFGYSIQHKTVCSYFLQRS